jgi:predicted nucleic-acid-binding protein
VIGLDTNVLVRYLTRDDEQRFAAVQAAFAHIQGSEETLFISLPVLLETVWVLQRPYKLSKEQLALTIQALLESPQLVIEEEALIEAALHDFIHDQADFADCLIGLRNREVGCSYTLTFDREAGQLPYYHYLPTLLSHPSPSSGPSR